jgi:hypothetical protein
MKRFVIASVLAVIGGVVVGAPLVSAGRAQPTITVTPNPVGAGHDFEVTPDDPESCPPSGTVDLSIAPEGGGDPVVTDSQPIPDGPWSFTESIDTPGSYVVGVSCTSTFDVNGPTTNRAATSAAAPGGKNVVIDYQPEALEVVGEFSVAANKTSGPVGTTVGVTGQFCSPGTGDSVAFKFVPDGTTPTFDVNDEDVQVIPVTLDNGGIAGTITVPNLPGGAYGLAAFCLSEGGTVLDGPVVLPFTISATPVVAPPTFTG